MTAIDRRRCSFLLVFVCVLAAIFVQFANLSAFNLSQLQYDELFAFTNNPPIVSDDVSVVHRSGSSPSAFPFGIFINDTVNKPVALKPPGRMNPKDLKSWSAQLKTPYLNSSSLQESGYFQAVGQSFARPYEKQPSSKFCRFHKLFRNQRRQSQQDGDPNVPSFVFVGPIEGMFYNKVPKAASSTLAGVNNRIALRQAERFEKQNELPAHAVAVMQQNENNKFSKSCTHAENHILGPDRFYGNRDPDKSFLWGSIREPASRALSRVFFFQISKARRPAEDETILHFLKNNVNPQSGTISPGKGGFQTQYLAMDSMEDWTAYSKSYPTLVQRPDVLHERVQKILKEYDFLAITERMDESLVALQLLLGLDVGDILTASASKTGGAYTEHRHKNGTYECIAIQSTFRSPAVKEYLTSDEWYAVNYADYILYAAANRSLDLTIQSLGKERFDKALLEFRNAKSIINERCKDRVYQPCSANGTPQVELALKDCYKYDEGCGYPCIDEVSLEKGW